MKRKKMKIFVNMLILGVLCFALGFGFGKHAPQKKTRVIFDKLLQLQRTVVNIDAERLYFGERETGYATAYITRVYGDSTLVAHQEELLRRNNVAWGDTLWDDERIF